METILPEPHTLELITLVAEPRAIRAIVRSTSDSNSCPCCGTTSRRIHSRYQRTLLDLPWHGVPMRLQLHVRRFFCDQPTCPRQIFTERLPTVVAPYAHRTRRLDTWFTQVGLAVGGEAGARLLHVLGLRSSPDTLLRRVRHTPPAAMPTPQIIGIDDFAFRRGQTYGTIIVDLMSHQILDLLPDRETPTVAAWLKTHPQITVVSRDRAQGYADAIRQGAPQAEQVADRFHLIQNLGQLLDRLLEAYRRQLHEAAQEGATAIPPADGKGDIPHHPPISAARQATQTRREQRHRAIVELIEQGYTLRETARTLHLSRETVTRYARHGTPPPATLPRRPSSLDGFARYLRRRWEQGEQNAAQLHREIQAQGYTGAESSLRRYVQRWRNRPRKRGRGSRCDTPTPLPQRQPRHFSPRQTRWLLMQSEVADAEAQAYLDRLRHHIPVLPQVQELVQEFLRLVREHRHADLPAWIAQAKASRIKELVSFAAGLERDGAAVAAALRLPWSQGPVEGSVNRLKLIKRSGYGRMHFDLLRQRVLVSQGN